MQFDVVIHANTISAHASTLYQTMAHRVAPLQVLPTAIAPTTTGLRNIDIVLTSSRTESVPVQAQYSEQVVLLRGVFQCFDFCGDEAWNRDGEALGEDVCSWASAADQLLVTGGSLYKLSPEFRAAAAKVLHEVPGSRLVLYPFNPNWGLSESNHWHKELVEAFADLQLGPDRVLVLPMISPAQIVSLLRMSHLYLDSFPYSGATSLLDPLFAGCPPVVLAGRTQRGLQGASILHAVEGQECIATSADEYTRIALSLLNDEPKRHALSVRLSRSVRSSSLLDVARFGQDVGRALRPYVARNGASVDARCQSFVTKPGSFDDDRLTQIDRNTFNLERNSVESRPSR